MKRLRYTLNIQVQDDTKDEVADKIKQAFDAILFQMRKDYGINFTTKMVEVQQGEK